MVQDPGSKAMMYMGPEMASLIGHGTMTGPEMEIEIWTWIDSGKETEAVMKTEGGILTGIAPEMTEDEMTVEGMTEAGMTEEEMIEAGMIVEGMTAQETTVQEMTAQGMIDPGMIV